MLNVQIRIISSVHLFLPPIKMGTNKCASQAGMTAYGTRRHLYDPKMQTDKPFDQTTISLQMGTNKGASQVSRTVCDVQDGHSSQPSGTGEPGVVPSYRAAVGGCSSAVLLCSG